jgi:choline dehydrogenase-like flavoprotein
MPDGREIPFFESHLLGGASVINGCVHTLGSKSKWNSILKRFNSNFDELMDSYNNIYSKSQYANIKNSNKINLTEASQNIIDKAFYKALGEINIPIGDTNFSNYESCGPVINTASKFYRSSVLSLIKKNRFKIVMGEKVEDVLFDSKWRVSGIKTDKRIIHADYIILSGGVIGNFELMSKLKNKKYNNKKNILRNIEVGKDIKDHTNLRINLIANKKIGSLNELSRSFIKKFVILFQHFSGRKTLMRGTGATSAVHLDLNNDGIVDTRIQIVQFTETGRLGSDGSLFSKEPGFSLSITSVDPKSRGEITLDQSESIVNPKYLSSKNDIELLKMALNFSMELLRSKSFSKHIFKILDENEIQNNIERYIFSNVYSGHHLIGGTHNLLNSNFEVNNTNGLYVCDASIFSEYAASNIHASVVVMSDIFSKKFLEDNLDL